MSSLKIMLGQVNPLVGDIHGNTELVKGALAQARQAMADVLILPELVLCGYPPEDLLLRPSLKRRVERALEEIAAQVDDSFYLVLGYPRISEEKRFNCVGMIHNGSIVAEYAKRKLPNYRVFDEKRYFSEGDQSQIVEIKGVNLALTICEDLWHAEPIAEASQQGADLVVNINASPWHTRKYLQRKEILFRRAIDNRIPIIYCNMVGGQDELVFDGASMAVDQLGEVVLQAASFEEAYPMLEVAKEDGVVKIASSENQQPLDTPQALYSALVLGVRDYVNKNGFNGVVLGLSGGIDSALTLAIAVDALGSDRVDAVMMPFRYTSKMSRDDAADQAGRMGVDYASISIEPMYEAFVEALKSEFAGTQADKSEENIQARCRGTIVMAISNKKGYLVLTTGNKSELAVGYATLYGDMAGGFDVLKDVSKTRVYELARYRNSIYEVIPANVITRPPSAELAPDQKDEDSLPPYDVLDQILDLYVEQDCSAAEIIHKGFDQDTVHRVLRMVDLNEYKRRQAPIGPRLTQRAFGRDRRYPITNGWKLGD